MFKAKICLLGEQGVGKTSLIRRYVKSTFRDDYVRTLGALVTKRRVVVEHARGTVYLDLMIWDVMGERSFLGSLGEAYFNRSEAALAVFDVTRLATLEALDSWMAAALHIAGPIPVTIIGNKVDLKEQRVVEEEEVRAIAQRHSVEYLFTSAKTGENVPRAFQGIAEALVAAKLEPPRRVEA